MSAPSSANPQVDRIIYLASLASDRQAIDPLLDDLRIITATHSAGEAFTAKDQATLGSLESKLINYLVTEDPLRSFTKESLSRRVSGQEAAPAQAKSVTRQFVTFVILAFAIPLITLSLPLLPSFIDRVYLAVPLVYAIFGIGTVWFYLSSLQNFRPELRLAFVLMCIGVGWMCFNFSASSVAAYFDLGQEPLFKYGGLAWSVALSFVFLYLGLKQYANMMRLKSTRLWVVAAVVGITAAILIIAPHPNPVDEEVYFDLSAASLAGYIVVAVFAAGLARAIKNSVTAAYTKSMRLIYLYLLICIPGSIVGLAALFYLGELNGAGYNAITGFFGIPPLLLLLYTGYSFKKETSQ